MECFENQLTFEVSVRLGYDAASLGNRIPMFRGSVVASSSRVEMSKNTHEDEGNTLPQMSGSA